jgi:nicotinate-nucleotide adenylyltransferase
LSRNAPQPSPDYLQVPTAAPNIRIGLLGGSFNPAHQGHLHISREALARLGLDQVWWLVSPGNPLKDPSKLPKLKERVEQAREIARHPKIVVTGFEAALGSVHTVDTVRFLARRFPQTHFVWLMGADNLADFHRWRAWEDIFARVPIAVIDRPGFGLKSRAGRAARRFAFARIDESDAGGLALIEPPAWTFLTVPLSRLSSTSLRRKETKKAHKAKHSKAKSSKAKTAKGRKAASGKGKKKARRP